MFRRDFALTFAVSLAVCAAGPALANPLPCPDASLSVVGQTVSFGVFVCDYEGQDTYVSASSVVRSPTTDAPTELDFYVEFAETSCPDVDAPVDVSFRTCSQSFEGGGGGEDAGSGAEGSYFEGVCGEDTCVPLGRWKYVVRKTTCSDCCYVFVVDVLSGDPTCPPDGAQDVVVFDASTDAHAAGGDLSDVALTDARGGSAPSSGKGGCALGGPVASAPPWMALAALALLAGARRRSWRA